MPPLRQEARTSCCHRAAIDPTSTSRKRLHINSRAGTRSSYHWAHHLPSIPCPCQWPRRCHRWHACRPSALPPAWHAGVPAPPRPPLGPPLAAVCARRPLSPEVWCPLHLWQQHTTRCIVGMAPACFSGRCVCESRCTCARVTHRPRDCPTSFSHVAASRISAYSDTGLAAQHARECVSETLH